jgi:hypothetical protein
MTERAADLPPTIPEPHRENIRKLSERIYKGTAHANAPALQLAVVEIDNAIRDINIEIEGINAALKGTPWSEAYSALVTMRDVVQNFSASLSIRRAAVGQYDTAWPGSRWRGG